MESNESLRKKVQKRGRPENLLPQAALKHGIWPFVRARVLRCDQCMLHKLFGGCPEHREGGECSYLEQRGIQLRDQLLSLPAVSAEDHELVADYIYHCQLIELVQAAMTGLGPLVEGKGKQLELHPLLARNYLAWSKRRQALGAELGIGALARRRLGQQGKIMHPLAALLGNLDAEEEGGGDGRADN